MQQTNSTPMTPEDSKPTCFYCGQILTRDVPISTAGLHVFHRYRGDCTTATSARIAQLEAQLAEAQKSKAELEEAIREDVEAEIEDEARHWDKDCARELYKLAKETGFEWEIDGDPADTIGDHISLTIADLRQQVKHYAALAAQQAEVFRQIYKDAHSVRLQMQDGGIYRQDTIGLILTAAGKKYTDVEQWLAQQIAKAKAEELENLRDWINKEVGPDDARDDIRRACLNRAARIRKEAGIA